MKNKIIYILIAVVLVASLVAISIFVLSKRANVPPKETDKATAPAETDKKSETGGEESETADGSFEFDTEEDETEPQGPVIAPDPIDPADPYKDVVFDSPDEMIEDPDPEADHEHKWELSGSSGGEDPSKIRVETYKCTVCGEEKNVYYPAEKHEFRDTVKDPTCTEGGYVTHECTLCGYVYRDSYKDALGHAFGEWKGDGSVETRTCSVCGFEESRTVVPSDSQSMIVSSGETAPGETVTLSVSINNNPGICSFALSFDYDADSLTLEEVTRSDSLGGQFNFAKRAVWIAFGDYKKDGEILTLTFRVSDSAKSGSEYPVSVSYASGDICNFNEDDVDFTVVAGSIKVK